MFVQLMIMAAATIFGASIGIVWSLPFVLLPLIGYQLFVLTDASELDTFNKLAPYSSILDSHDNPSGFVLGWSYIGYIHVEKVDRGADKRTLYLVCTKRFKVANLKPVVIKDKSITYVSHVGNYFNLSYIVRQLPVEQYHVRSNQMPIVNDILSIYKTSHTHNAVVYVHGLPRCGKSTLGLLVAKALSGMFMNTYKPYEQGFNLEAICKSVKPTAKNPLVLMFEEVDYLLNIIVPGGEILAHKHIPTEIRNKQTWNTYFDNLGLYPHVIIIMTSNVNYANFDNMDASLLGTGRVDAKYHLKDYWRLNIVFCRYCKNDYVGCKDCRWR